MTSPPIGIPYAEAHVDASGCYYVTCPLDGIPFYDTGLLDKQEADPEDRATKGAAYSYALHYERCHTERHGREDCALPMRQHDAGLCEGRVDRATGEPLEVLGERGPVPVREYQRHLALSARLRFVRPAFPGALAAPGFTHPFRCAPYGERFCFTCGGTRDGLQHTSRRHLECAEGRKES